MQLASVDRRSSYEAKAETTAAPLAIIGLDIGKDVFHLVGFGVDGKIAFRSRIRRLDLKDVFEKMPPRIVGMEASGRIHISDFRQHPLTCEGQPAHTFEA
jgi:hypothetical protein